MMMMMMTNGDGEKKKDRMKRIRNRLWSLCVVHKAENPNKPGKDQRTRSPLCSTTVSFWTGGYGLQQLLNKQQCPNGLQATSDLLVAMSLGEATMCPERRCCGSFHAAVLTNL